MYVQVKPRAYKPAVRLVEPRSKWQLLKEKFRWLGSIAAYINRFFMESCIHGFAYLVNNKLTMCENVFWLVLLIVSLAMCIFVGMQSMYRFRHKGTVIGLERDFYFWRTALPSMTVCPMYRLDRELFEKFCRKRKIVDRAKEEFFMFLESLANSTFINFSNLTTFPSLDMTLERARIKPHQYMSLIYNLTVDHTHEDLGSDRVFVTDGFENILTRAVLTEFGICYMTNSYLSDKYNARYAVLGKHAKHSKDVQKVSKGNYFDSSVILIMTVPKSFMAMATYIHSPYDAFKIDRNFYYTKEGSYVVAESAEIRVEEGFEKMTDIEQRNCRFPHESNLTHFPIYTKNFCMQECRLEMIFKKCKCIPHFYPNRIKNPKPVCTYSALKRCVGKHAVAFRQLRPTRSVKLVPCFCQADCIASSVIIKKFTMLQNLGILGTGFSASIEVQTWPQELLKRQVIFSFTDLLVNIGGAAGLFLGFSVLGAVEFGYYFTLRLIWYLRGYGR